MGPPQPLQTDAHFALELDASWLLAWARRNVLSWKKYLVQKVSVSVQVIRLVLVRLQHFAETVVVPFVGAEWQ